MFNLRSLDLNLLTIFEAIYELGTVNAAADRLALSQSTTSHALSRLSVLSDWGVWCQAVPRASSHSRRLLASLRGRRFGRRMMG